MANPMFHAVSSARQFGGDYEDYLAIHTWFDFSKSYLADARHRALRHHGIGIAEAERVFGSTVTNKDGAAVLVYNVGVQHCEEDFGFVPTLEQWTELLPTNLSDHKLEARFKDRDQEDVCWPMLRRLARELGGVSEDYKDFSLHLNNQTSKDNRNGLLHHHAQGIFNLENIWGQNFIRESDGKRIPTRYVGEKHILSDFGRIPTVVEWLQLLPLQPWMARGAKRLSLEQEIAGMVPNEVRETVEA